MSITYGTIEVQGFPFSKIIELHISHQPNEHGFVTIVGQIDPQAAKDCLERSDETTKIVVNATGKEKQCLFAGGVLNLSVKNEAQYSIMTVTGVTSSYLQDIKKICRTYQNGTRTYEEILNEAYDGNGSVEVMITDRAIGPMILQMDETNWAFTKRMASRANTAVFADIQAVKPRVFVGLPPSDQTKPLSSVAFYESKQEAEYNEVTQNYLADGIEAMRQDFTAITAKSYDYAYLGNIISFNDVNYYIKSVLAKLVDGLLEMTYKLVRKTGFIAPLVANDTCSGRILVGQVKAVKQDLVQVHMVEIDEEYDESGNWWFPYSTAYSSKDGSGWYVMPEIGDYVRIMFPSRNEADGFAASSINLSPLGNPRHKSFKAPSGKELLMTDEGIFVICKHQKIFIDLMEADGIKIVSSKDINLLSSANITVQAANEVQILAKKQILIGTAESSITITPEKISLAAKDVVIA